MNENLVIVESPSKAKTISKFLGKDFIVESCFGHIRDLPKKNIGIDFEKNYEPLYEVPKDKSKLVQELKKLAKKSETIWLASDEDREGEAIAWHLQQILDLKKQTVKRIVFHEITKKAILHAIENAREINQNLVDAQQARRVLDRILGYKLSPVLWSKVKKGLSAGRVQSVAVRLIVEKEREIKNYTPNHYFHLSTLFQTENNKEIEFEYPKKIESEKETISILNSIQKNDFTISNIEKKESYRNPSAPFTTSTLQQTASSKLGFSVTKTMIVAQKLYEAGHITYMRTDSTNLSGFALEGIKKAVLDAWGEKYYSPRNFHTKNKNAQEAHEAIRSTSFDSPTLSSGTNEEKRLYQLIWKQTVASQMSKAVLDKTTYTATDASDKIVLKTQGSILRFDGFLACTDEKSADVILPELKLKQPIFPVSSEAIEKITSAPARYSEASLVKQLEELGIGRPSTYAPTISTIQKRTYISLSNIEGIEVKLKKLTWEKDKAIESHEVIEQYGKQAKKLIPTTIGTQVNDFLVTNFPNILNYQFTADVENDFDEIAQGKKEWVKTIDDFYKGFTPILDSVKVNSERIDTAIYLGQHPKTNQYISAKIGRFGPMVQMGGHEKYNEDKEEKPKFASIPKEFSVEDITLEQAVELLSLPKKVGSYKDEEILVNTGRFGPYLLWNKKFFSVSKPDFTEISLDEAIQVIEDKLKVDNIEYPVFKHIDKEITVAKGRFGVYFKYNNKNYALPKNTSIEKIDLELCLSTISKKDKKTK